MVFIQKGTFIVSQLTIKLYIKQKFIHWAPRRRLNNHCNSKVRSDEEWQLAQFRNPSHI